MGVEVEVVAVIHSEMGDASLRKDGCDEPGLFIKPDLDGDGEWRVLYSELAAVFKALGVNRVDLFPES